MKNDYATKKRRQMIREKKLKALKAPPEYLIISRAIFELSEMISEQREILSEIYYNSNRN